MLKRDSSANVNVRKVIRAKKKELMDKKEAIKKLTDYMDFLISIDDDAKESKRLREEK
jgi:hypothetical protein